VIYYTKASHHLLPSVIRAGADVLSVDWRVSLADLRRLAGPKIALQGNLDPTLLFAREETIRARTLELVAELGGQGHILNLGHGILQHTPVENAQVFIQTGQWAKLPEARTPVPSRV
jgi:uroporphyrinogen decarboxylase